MRKITLGGQEYPATFTTWAAHEFFRLTGMNLYEPGQIKRVFKNSEGAQMQTSDFENVAKFAYVSMAAGCMPLDAGEDWKPPFTWQSVMNRFSIRDSNIYAQLLSIYSDQDVELPNTKETKNLEAPQLEGRTTQ